MEFKILCFFSLFLPSKCYFGHRNCVLPQKSGSLPHFSCLFVRAENSQALSLMAGMTPPNSRQVKERQSRCNNEFDKQAYLGWAGLVMDGIGQHCRYRKGTVSSIGNTIALSLNDIQRCIFYTYIWGSDSLLQVPSYSPK